MLIDSSRLIERGTTWFLRSRRLSDDMAATIAQFTPRVEALATRLPELTDAGDRARVDAAVDAYVASGVPRALAARVVALDTLYSTLDIVEVGDATKRPVEVVADLYFSVSARLGVPWLRGKIATLPQDQHWRRLAKGAMLDDLSGLQRTVTDGGAGRRWRHRGPAGVDRGVAGAESARNRTRGSVAGRAARSADARSRDALRRIARIAHARVVRCSPSHCGNCARSGSPMLSVTRAGSRRRPPCASRGRTWVTLAPGTNDPSTTPHHAVSPPARVASTGHVQRYLGVGVRV